MVFHVEKITTPEQRAEFAAFGFRQPGTTRPSDASDWIVDRARGIYIASLGGGMFERPNFFELVTRDGVKASIEARVNAEGSPVPQGLEVWWHVSAIRVPDEHGGSAAEIRGGLIEALTEYGFLGETQYSKQVHVDFFSDFFADFLAAAPAAIQR